MKFFSFFGPILILKKEKEGNGYSKITVFFFFITNLITCGSQNLKRKENLILGSSVD